MLRGDSPAGLGQVAINARAAVREHVGGVERLAREMTRRLPALRPERYRVIRPPERLAHRAGHLWEQAILPLRAAACALIYSPANLAPVVSDENVLVLHDLAALRHPDAYSRFYVAYQRRVLPVLARRARLVITVSEFSRSELVSLLEVDPAKLAVIPEGVDERFAPQADDPVARVRRRYGLERPYVLSVGTVSARKNLDLLAPAARALGDRGIEIVVAGSDRGYLRPASVPLRRLGYVSEAELPALYSGALALAQPSRYEGFGLPCLEAMACGTPVVAARCGALPETVGEAGLLIEPNPEAFAGALVDLATDASMRERLAGAGRQRAAAFSWSRCTELTDRVIGRLLDGTAPIGGRPCSTHSNA